MEEMKFQEEPNCEDRTLYLLSDSEIDQEFLNLKLQKESGPVTYQKQPLRGPLSDKDIEKSILQLKEKESREDALDRLRQYLIERREKEPRTYAKIGYWLHESCGTVVILLQEVMAFSVDLADGKVGYRSYNRIANVLTLFQSVAANSETAREDLVAAEIPSLLIHLIEFNQGVRHFQAVDRVRAYALSVVGILCQIGIHILKTILQNQAGLSYICSPQRGNYKLLLKLMKTLGHMVAFLARNQDDSPRLLFHIIGCYILLCGDMRGLRVVKKSLPHHFTKSLPYHITDKFFQETKEEHPNIRELVEQLLLTVEAH